VVVEELRSVDGRALEYYGPEITATMPPAEQAKVCLKLV
jgi:hypothetical protein